MSAFDTISASEVGRRFRLARDNAGLTQQEATDEIGIARTTLVAIEKGSRRIRMDEARQLAKLYGVSVNALFRQEAVHIDLVPRFHKLLDADDKAAGDAVKIISRFAKAEVELENLLGIKRIKNFPAERRILPGDVNQQAETDALEFRSYLGLGNAPITDIIKLLEMELGVRVYVRPVDSRISGLFAHDEALGSCMLLNANHSRVHRTQVAAHECGHFVSTRSEPEVLHADEDISSREERYADAFGRAFLTPARAVKQKFQEVTSGSDKLLRQHVVVLADYFGVSCESMVHRLEGFQLIRAGSWDWFQSNGGITDQYVKQVLGNPSITDKQKEDAERTMPLRLSMLAAKAYQQELLTEEQLSELLDMDRIELRGILDDLEVEESEADAPFIRSG